MAYFVGLDVSVSETAVCVVDEAGRVICEQKVPSEPDDIVTLLTSIGEDYGRVGIEAGPLSQWLVNGMANIRELNKSMDWSLPTDGPKTLNGLIVEYLETIPESGTGLKINGYPIEIIETRGNRVQLARIHASKSQDAARPS